MNVKAEATNLFRAGYQQAYAFTRNELPLSDMLDARR
jgi:hypothetical protein